ncbi:HNH endonuclease [Roseivirga echinicomitans]|uniref:HNH nuclease domain-containing protein n=1 Tax=Roseivirga echinicomitans TaxID=296218 RepID=A0A150XCN8_9BACT|nr:HNH endonuclease signature motif containing protein [Roseivirga echinicomitans]KYG76461.1 hypothetical protein AWN68_05345 [Roseivirga echinicomitans]
MESEIKYTEHLDGSKCNRIKQLGRKSEIAKHWRESIFKLGLFMDWGEPSCWACGIFDNKHDIQDSTLAMDEIFKVWDKQNYLERCHVIPKSLGGCSCSGNIVLLCKRCHKDNPDTNDLLTFKLWIQNRKSHAVRRVAELTSLFEEFGLKINDLDFFLLSSCQEFKNHLINNLIPVRGKFTDATKLAALLEWKRGKTEEELLNKLPKYVQEEINAMR